MRTTLLMICLFSLFSGKAQDTVYAKPDFQEKISNLSPDIYLMSNCAHGHICCSVGCHCCTELHRPQLYDTIYFPVQHGIQRIAIVERYRYAREHARSMVHYRFKNEKGELSQRWYLASLNPFDYFEEDQPLAHYPKEIEKKYKETNSILVQNDAGEFHLIDLDGNILPMRYHQRKQVDTNTFLSMFILPIGRIYGFTDSLGNQIGLLTYSKVFPFNRDGKAVIVDQNGLHGLVHCSGKLILPCNYHDLKDLGSERFAANLNGTTFLINSEGLVLSKENYQNISAFSEGLASAKVDNKTYAYLTLNGSESFRIKTEYTENFSDGMAGIYNNGKWGFIDKTGKQVIDRQFDRVLPFCEGVAPVQLKNGTNRGEWGLIDRQGNFISKTRYDDMMNFKKGLARVFMNGQGYGLIDTQGKEVIPCIYFLEGYGTPEDWFVFETLIRKKVGPDNIPELVDRTGNVLTHFDGYVGVYNVMNPQNGAMLPYLLAYKKDNSRTLIDLQGKEILKHHYESVSVLSENRAFGKIGKSLFLIDLSTGKHLQEFPADQYYSFQDEILMFETQDYPRVYSYYTMDGEVLEF